MTAVAPEAGCAQRRAPRHDATGYKRRFPLVLNGAVQAAEKASPRPSCSQRRVRRRRPRLTRKEQRSTPGAASCTIHRSVTGAKSASAHRVTSPTPAAPASPLMDAVRQGTHASGGHPTTGRSSSCANNAWSLPPRRVSDARSPEVATVGCGWELQLTHTRSQTKGRPAAPTRPVPATAICHRHHRRPNHIRPWALPACPPTTVRNPCLMVLPLRYWSPGLLLRGRPPPRGRPPAPRRHGGRRPPRPWLRRHQTVAAPAGQQHAGAQRQAGVARCRGRRGEVGRTGVSSIRRAPGTDGVRARATA